MQCLIYNIYNIAAKKTIFNYVKFYLIEQKVFFRYFPFFQRYFSYWRNGGGLCDN